LSRGDEVIITTEDYGTFIDAWAQRVRRDGIVLRRITVPVPPRNLPEILQPFRQAINPRTKAVMFSHISDMTGLIFPVREVADIAHAVGAHVIVDGALSFGCIPVDIKSLDCDYYATSLHKGIFAPTSTGFLYVRHPCIRGVWPLLGASESLDDDVRKFEQWGTAPAGPYAAIDDALDFHEVIGTDYLAARYHYLKRSWADRLVGLKRIRFLTPLDRAYSSGIAKVHLEGTDPIRLRQYLYVEKGI
jgi:selenocysteine lyase/cysteine desulfurase